jgi:hypothetical protein
MIVRDRQGNQTDLHAFWDRLLSVDFSYAAVVRAADDLQAAPTLQRDALAELRDAPDIPAWVQESFRTAVTLAYAENRVQFVFPEALASGKVAASAVPQLTPDYVHDAREVARRRLALAAWRLGDALKPAWSE